LAEQVAWRDRPGPARHEFDRQRQTG
jgi:hypothetical protein